MWRVYYTGLTQSEFCKTFSTDYKNGSRKVPRSREQQLKAIDLHAQGALYRTETLEFDLRKSGITNVFKDCNSYGEIGTMETSKRPSRIPKIDARRFKITLIQHSKSTSRPIFYLR